DAQHVEHFSIEQLVQRPIRAHARPARRSSFETLGVRLADCDEVESVGETLVRGEMRPHATTTRVVVEQHPDLTETDDCRSERHCHAAPAGVKRRRRTRAVPPMFAAMDSMSPASSVTADGSVRPDSERLSVTGYGPLAKRSNGGMRWRGGKTGRVSIPLTRRRPARSSRVRPSTPSSIRIV